MVCFDWKRKVFDIHSYCLNLQMLPCACGRYCDSPWWCIFETDGQVDEWRECNVRTAPVEFESISENGPANFPPTRGLTFDLLVPASLLTQVFCRRMVSFQLWIKFTRCICTVIQYIDVILLLRQTWNSNIQTPSDFWYTIYRACETYFTCMYLYMHDRASCFMKASSDGS